MNNGIKEQIQNLAKDLLNLEVITIIKPSITGRKMPDPNTALAEIGRKYNIKLVELDRAVKLAEGVQWGSYQAFAQILETTNAEIKEFKSKIKALQKVEKDLTAKQKSDLWMLYRIKTMSQAIQRLYKRKSDGRWDFVPATDNLVLIRKAWELGVEEIAMKTVIQLDGDVITRVQERYATEEHTTVHKLHNMGVTTSLAFWKTLVEIVESFITGLVKLIFPKK
ncbi:MAG: hypothetical protein ACE5I1_33300 [bacterium]